MKHDFIILTDTYLCQKTPAVLEIKKTTESNTSASYLDMLLGIERDGQQCTSLFDKVEDFNFNITHFNFLSRNIPSSPAYDVFISGLAPLMNGLPYSEEGATFILAFRTGICRGTFEIVSPTELELSWSDVSP